MDVESVRSGHSERSDRSHRSHRSRHGIQGGNGRLKNHGIIGGPPPSSQGGQMLPMMSSQPVSQLISGPLYSSQQQPQMMMNMGPPMSQHQMPMMSQQGFMPMQHNQGPPLNSWPNNPGAPPYVFQPPHQAPPPMPGNPYHQPSQPLMQHQDFHQSNQMQQHQQETERIEVQILPQDDNWGETNTALTGATSETGVSLDNVPHSKDNSTDEDVIGFDCAHTMGIAVSLCMGLVSFLSPIVMVVLPKVGFMQWNTLDCESACEGQLINLIVKLLILLLASLALFFRRNHYSMPRVFIFRALLLFLVFVVTFAFWLFYGVRILEKKAGNYHNIVLFAVSLTDALLFLHYLALVVLEIRHLQPRYSVKVVRHPDGETGMYRLGEMSIQRAAVFILQQYVTDFQVYNQYLANAAHRRTHFSHHRSKSGSHHSGEGGSTTGGGGGGGKYKFYGVDGGGLDSAGNTTTGGGGTTSGGGGDSTPALTGNGGPGVSRSVRSARSRGSHHGGSRPASERFYEEAEYEKRVKKRKARLMASLDEAFTHIKKETVHSQGSTKAMDPYEAAQAIIPTLLKPLQKYLRITRQQPRYTIDMIIDHLALCLDHNLGPKAFAQRYLEQGPVIEDAKNYRPRQTWTILCDTLISRGLSHGAVFQLRRQDVSLLVTVRQIPFFSVAEEVLDPNNSQFVLRLNSETSV